MWIGWVVVVLVREATTQPLPAQGNVIRTYIYQSQNLTVASARNCRVCRAGADRAQGRVKQCRTGHGRGTDQKRQSKSRSERGQKQGRA